MPPAAPTAYTDIYSALPGQSALMPLQIGEDQSVRYAGKGGAGAGMTVGCLCYRFGDRSFRPGDGAMLRWLLAYAVLLGSIGAGLWYVQRDSERLYAAERLNHVRAILDAALDRFRDIASLSAESLIDDPLFVARLADLGQPSGANAMDPLYQAIAPASERLRKHGLDRIDAVVLGGDDTLRQGPRGAVCANGPVDCGLVRDSLRADAPTEGFVARPDFIGYQAVRPVGHLAGTEAALVFSVGYERLASVLAADPDFGGFALVIQGGGVDLPASFEPLAGTDARPASSGFHVWIGENRRVTAGALKMLLQAAQSGPTGGHRSAPRAEIVRVNGQARIAVLLPISGSSDTAAFIATMSEDPLLVQARERFRAIMIVLAIGLFALGVLGTRFSAGRRAERAELARLTWITDTMQEGLYVVDTAGRITFANRAAERILGFERAELTGRTPQGLFREQTDAGVPSPERLAMDSGTPAEALDTEFRRKDGTLVPVDVASAPLFKKGVVEGAVITFSDIGSRKDAEARLQVSEAHAMSLERQAALSGLVASVAHELNTPIGVGITSASFLSQKVRQIRSAYAEDRMTRSGFAAFLDAAAEAAALLETNLERAAHLVQSFKRVAVDQTSDARRSFDLKDYIEGVLISLGPRYCRTRHTVSVRIPEGIVLDSYPGALAQVVTNLLFNALEHAFEADRAGVFEIVARPPRQGEVEIVFRDNGRGIVEGQRDRVFEPFFTTNRAGGGSGLGLSIVLNNVTTVLGGRISVGSADMPGFEGGAQFIAVLPLTAPLRDVDLADDAA